MKEEIVYKNVDDLIPYENNPRNNGEAVEYVANSIKEFGFKVPIVIDENNIIIAGHTRLKASKTLGIEKVPVIVAEDLTDEQVKAFRLADNKTGEFANWDPNMLGKELAELDKLLDEGWEQAFGFEMERIDIDDFGDTFELPEGEQSDMRTMSFQLHYEQKELVEYAMEEVKNEINETFGNENKNGNALYEVVRQWQALRT